MPDCPDCLLINLPGKLCSACMADLYRRELVETADWLDGRAAELLRDYHPAGEAAILRFRADRIRQVALKGR